MTTLTTPQRRPIRDLVASHPMMAFMGLACAISWCAWYLSEYIDLGVTNGFGIIFSAGPALAAMVVSAFLKPGPSEVPRASRWRWFAIIGVLALAIMAARRLWITPEWLRVAGNVTATAAYPGPAAFLVDILAAGVVGFVFSGACSSRRGVRELLRSLNLREHPVEWYWCVLAAGLYPVLILCGNVIAAGFGLPVPASQVVGPWYLLGLDVLLTSLYFVIGGGGAEEPGWRGFALPLIQQRYSPLISSLVLGVIWGIWHMPLFWVQGAFPVAFALYVLLEVVPLAILFTAVFNRTGGSLPVVILLHVSVNIVPVFLPVSSLASILWLLLMLGIALWMWRAPGLSRQATHGQDSRISPEPHKR